MRILTGVIAGLISMQPAMACTPLKRVPVSPFYKIAKSERVFVARLKVKEIDLIDQVARYRLTVIENFKGGLKPRQELKFFSHISGSMCGFRLRDGFYVFYLRQRTNSQHNARYGGEPLSIYGFREQFETATQALSAARHYFGVLRKSQSDTQSLRVSTSLIENDVTQAILGGSATLTRRVEQMLAAGNGCFKQPPYMIPGVYRHRQIGLLVNWLDRSTGRFVRHPPDCVTPLAQKFYKPGDYTVHVSLFKPGGKNAPYEIHYSDWQWHGKVKFTVNTKARVYDPHDLNGAIRRKMRACLKQGNC